MPVVKMKDIDGLGRDFEVFEDGPCKVDKARDVVFEAINPPSMKIIFWMALLPEYFGRF